MARLSNWIVVLGCVGFIASACMRGPSNVLQQGVLVGVVFGVSFLGLFLCAVYVRSPSVALFAVVPLGMFTGDLLSERLQSIAVVLASMNAVAALTLSAVADWRKFATHAAQFLIVASWLTVVLTIGFAIVMAVGWFLGLATWHDLQSALLATVPSLTVAVLLIRLRPLMLRLTDSALVEEQTQEECI